MHASVTLKGPDGQEHLLGHGDFVGRVWSAALCIDDARISEAHAMVSLRGDTLRLLALRGLFAVGGQVQRSVALETGLRISLAQGLDLEVVAVELPDRVLALTGPGMSPQPLAGTCSLVMRPSPRLRPGARDGAQAVFHMGPNGWRVRGQDGQTQDLQAGWRDESSGFEVRWQLLEGQGQATQVRQGVSPPMKIEARYDSVLIHRQGFPTFRVTGLSARIISELALVAGPLHWEPLARELWTDGSDPHFLRRRLDAVLGRLRRKLSDSKLPLELVRSDGAGYFELVLRPQDELVTEA
ncbi:MAG: hypothetical protein ACI9VR_002387 [Cognaticolwellia sp.]|jgi:hypothetical protein